MKNRILFKIGFFSGLVPLVVGLFIFFIWWIARAFYAIDLDRFEVYGFFWILLSIPIATIGLILHLIFIFKNYPRFLKYPFLGILLILVNIPITFILLDKQTDIGNRAYIKIYNKTNIDNIDLILKTSTFEKKIGNISNCEQIVDFYYPKILDDRGDSSYPTFDTVTLIVKDKLITHNLTLPRIKFGQCLKLYIDKEFKLIDKLNK